MARDGVILNPCKASLAVPDCTSFSNSTKAMSERPGTKRTSLNPGNLQQESAKYKETNKRTKSLSFKPFKQVFLQKNIKMLK